jgi:hypothetical protein
MLTVQNRSQVVEEDGTRWMMQGNGKERVKGRTRDSKGCVHLDLTVYVNRETGGGPCKPSRGARCAVWFPGCKDIGLSAKREGPLKEEARDDG